MDNCKVCGKPINKFPYASHYRKLGYCRNHIPDNCKSLVPPRHTKKRKTRLQVQCIGATKEGVQCKRMVRASGSGFCGQHKNQRQDKKNERTIEPKKYIEYINSKSWQKKSKEIRSEYNDRCRLCNRTGVIHAHHRTYERLGNEKPEDLTPLCKDCHDLFGSNYKYNSKLHVFQPI